MNASEETLAAQLAFAAAPAVVGLAATTATQLTTTPTKGKKGTILAADAGNTSPIYIGTDNTVTNLVGWTVVLPGGSAPILFPMGDASKLWAYTTGTGQKFGWSVL